MFVQKVYKIPDIPFVSKQHSIVSWLKDVNQHLSTLRYNMLVNIDKCLLSLLQNPMHGN